VTSIGALDDARCFGACWAGLLPGGRVGLAADTPRACDRFVPTAN